MLGSAVSAVCCRISYPSVVSRPPAICASSRSWRVALEQTFAAACFGTAPHNCSAERLQLSVPAIKSAFALTEWLERLCKGGLRCVHVVRSINDAQRIEI